MESVAAARSNVLVAYIYQRAGTPSATKILLRDYIEWYADREGLVLDSIFVGVEGQSDRFSVKDLVRHVESCGATTVLVAGPAYRAIQSLGRLENVRVLTLADAHSQLTRPKVWVR